jgi:alpha-ketoglutarate-dependent taurine dioxygenase
MKTEVHSWKKLPSAETFGFKLSEDLLLHILDFLKDQKDTLADPNKLTLDPYLKDFFRCYDQLLKNNPGFILLKARESLSDQELRLIYALCCRSFGRLNDRYGYFFDVIDQGLDYTKEAVPVSKTKAATGYHTDSTAKAYFPDLVGLLCLQPGASGGDSLLTNAADVYQELLRTAPDSLLALEKPVIRDVITPGTTNSKETILKNAFPVFSEQDDLFTFRYMRYWIETAHSKTDIQLPEELFNGLEAIDHYFSLPENTVQFRMERGDILIINNRFLCHNRTAFENSLDQSKYRTLVRAWINFEIDPR